MSTTGRSKIKEAARRLLLIVLLLCSMGAWAQEPAPAKPQPPAETEASQEPPTATEVPQKPPAASAPQPEHKLSPKEAEELFKSVDEILEWVSKDTGLPIKNKVKRQLASRDEVVKYVEQKLAEDEDTQRLERSAVTLKKFGLLPREFELRPYLLGLLKEQVAGFYDTKTKTVYLLDWVELEGQKAVLAHELTHALQDQNFDIEKWGKGKGKPKTDAEIIAHDEEASAKQAVMEGQAMITLLDYSLAPVGATVVDSPAIVEAMKAGMVSNNTGSPLFDKAPLFLRTALVFPYQYGIDFIRDVLVKRGRAAAFAGTIRNSPVSTRQVMMPETYLSGEKIPWLVPPGFDQLLGKGYARYDFGGIGQFDVGVMMQQWASPDAARAVSPSWRGGYYWTGRKQGVSDGQVSLAFVTKWANTSDARAFAEIYGRSLVKRYKKVEQVTAFEKNGPGEWSTEEGPARVLVHGDTVIATEGFDAETSRKIEDAVEPVKQ